jgi:hypothetical protein
MEDRRCQNNRKHEYAADRCLREYISNQKRWVSKNKSNGAKRFFNNQKMG